jgi:hypothetical protein
MIYIRYIYSFFENKLVVKKIDKLVEFILLKLIYSFVSSYNNTDVLSRRLLKTIFINNKEWMELLNFLPDVDENNELYLYIKKNLDTNIINFYKSYNITLTKHSLYDLKDIISMIVIYFMIEEVNTDLKFNKYTKLMLSDKYIEDFSDFIDTK